MLKRVPLYILFCLATIRANADLQLSITADYPARLDLKIPVKENSDFKIYTSFGDGEYFNATGHVCQITGTDQVYTVIYGYEYNVTNGIGHATGSATGSKSNALHSLYDTWVVSSLWDLNPDFKVEEVASPVSPQTWLTNASMTNFPVTNADENGESEPRPHHRRKELTPYFFPSPPAHSPGETHSP